MRSRTIAAGLLVATVVGMVGGEVISDRISYKQQTEIQQMKEINLNNAQQEIEKLYSNGKLLKESLSRMNEMIIAKGNIETSYRFSNKDDYIMYDYQNAYNPMKVVWNKLTYRDVVFTAKYNYNIVYDLSKVETKIENGCLIIVLHEGFLRVKDFSIDYDTAYVDESNGLLARDFSSNETSAMIGYAKTHTENYVRSKQDFIENAMISLENNIKHLCEQFGIERYMFETYENNTLTNQDKFVTVNRYSQQSIDFNN